MGPGALTASRWPPVVKRFAPGEARPNLHDDERARAEVSWDDVRRSLSGLAVSRGLNIAHEAVDRQAGRSLGRRVAPRAA